MKYFLFILLLISTTTRAQFHAGLYYLPCSVAAITGTLTVNETSTTQLSNATAGGTWSSSTTTVATIGTAGLVTGVSQGTSTITYSLGAGCEATAVVTVTLTYPTLNPSHKGGFTTLSGGNLTATSIGTGLTSCTLGKSSGLAYYEVLYVTRNGSTPLSGLLNYQPANGNTGDYFGNIAVSYGWRGSPWSYEFNIGGGFSNTGPIVGLPVAGDVVSWAINRTAATAAVYYNGVLKGTITGIPSGTFYPTNSGTTSNETTVWNFGQNAWDARTAALRTTLAGLGYTIGWY
jgi:hypothetical protein